MANVSKGAPQSLNARYRESRYVEGSWKVLYSYGGSCSWRKAYGMLAHNNCFTWLPSPVVYNGQLQHQISVREMIGATSSEMHLPHERC